MTTAPAGSSLVPIDPMTDGEYQALLQALVDVVIEYRPAERTFSACDSGALPPAFFAGDGRAVVRRWLRHIAAADRARVIEGLHAIAQTGQASWMEEYDFRYDGRDYRVVHRFVRLGGADGRPLRHVHLLQDSTERRRAQELLAAERAELERRVAERTRALAEKNVELARAVAHKDEFLTSMSHELRTPLNAVLGLTDVLLEGIGGPVTDQQVTWLRDIRESGRHLLGLINDILDLARIDADRLTLAIQPVDPAELANAAIRLVAGTAFERSIAILPDIAKDLPPMHTDGRLARQILVNLLGNAVKFTPSHGQVRFEMRPVPGGGRVRFDVVDSGPGIPADRVRDIFRPFVQLDGGLTREAGGTGLGLALASKMADRLGGSISLETQEGVGSRFTVVLPSLQPEPRETDAGQVPIVEGSTAGPAPLDEPLHVLLAEDNPANVRIFSAYLEAKGCRVTVAVDGVEAVERAVESLPQVILMDIQMPRMDGLQAIRTIRGNPDPRIAKVPIVALTALAMPGDRERCLEAGADAYLAKPARPREILAAVRALAAEAGG